ncbi:MAG TPA: long-chain fatty acid--CoA ligase [Acidimicrobiales bacterium]|nr:long-chain fatty acid--CoA ligase [Acidimicrobiales bacterium]
MPATLTAAPPAAITASALRAATIVDLFRAQARSRPNAVAMRRHDGLGWDTITWRDYEQAVAEVALGLLEWGLEPGDRVGLLSGNRPEWHIADLGILCAGMVSTPVYATSSSSQVAHVLSDAGARLCFVEDGQQLAKVLVQRDGLPQVLQAVALAPLDGVEDHFVRGLAELRRAGAERLAAEPGAFDELVNSVTPEQLATLVYTSGTTGPPKGAMISHANVMATLRSLASFIDLTPTDRFLSFLPLSHITERCVSHFGQIASGGETWFARSIGTVPEDLQACRPTLFFAVPRVWEKFQEAILEGVDRAPGPLAAVTQRYLGLAARHGDGTGPPMSTAEQLAYRSLNRSIGRVLRHRLGLDRARMLSSGAAPVHPDLLRWFHGIGLPIAEGYGQTEVTLCTTLNPADAIRIGTVGRPIPGVELQIAGDGEILVRAPNVCQGYWGKPEASAELIDPDGWLHTGDVGSIDGDGYLRISGRKKELIITAYGKNIAPAEIETALRHEPLISQAVVIGDNRPFLTALLTLDADAAVEWAHRERRTLTVEALAEDEGIRSEIADAVERVNALHSHAEGIRRWRLLPHDLSVASGELTPTLKVKREVVTASFAGLIEEMYADA